MVPVRLYDCLNIIERGQEVWSKNFEDKNSRTCIFSYCYETRRKDIRLAEYHFHSIKSVFQYTVYTNCFCVVQNNELCQKVPGKVYLVIYMQQPRYKTMRQQDRKSRHTPLHTSSDTMCRTADVIHSRVNMSINGIEHRVMPVKWPGQRRKQCSKSVML